METKDNLKISFCLLCLFIIINFLLVGVDNIGTTIFAFIFIIDIIWCFIVSIIHLKEYKEKGFAITSLVISSIMILIMFVIFISGVFIDDPLYYLDYIDLNYSAELECESICSEFDLDKYKISKENDNKFSCDCYNNKGLVVSYWLYGE